MVYRKRKSSYILEKAELRAAGLTAISPQIDFGHQRSLSYMTTQIESLRDKLSVYNASLTTLDTLLLEIKDMEKSLANLTEQMLLGVAFEYGKNSPEYQMAGGVRKQDRIRRSSIARLKAEVGAEAS